LSAGSTQENPIADKGSNLSKVRLDSIKLILLNKYIFVFDDLYRELLYKKGCIIDGTKKMDEIFK
jgi:hypothetical protein